MFPFCSINLWRRGDRRFDLVYIFHILSVPSLSFDCFYTALYLVNSGVLSSLRETDPTVLTKEHDGSHHCTVIALPVHLVM